MSSSSGSSAYAFKPGGSLKLKGDDGKKDKKKKKKLKSSISTDSKYASASTSLASEQRASKDVLGNSREGEIWSSAEISSGVTASGRKMTDAERKFEEVKRKRMQQRIAKEARTSHKDKVDAFNKYLASLSEHHDIPKVGPG
ncbi:uncharacterized protein MEPE_04974 [Melanopsichium pennsylvanicum]|uniref:DUF1754-domain-containing protein n=2 Tax=Melanopsichium pennsylvanicum TaxID=63383 RepID=A0AAJ5C6V7_9BASI|nr:uncharacterized protein BN887_03126 [Melanopsichium pennsylvanicum 4]SNX86265.1 uncharacterized protein MEPE_04974 [Melanopsichium pennsylvanicum]